jgi:hypothetical protein
MVTKSSFPGATSLPAPPPSHSGFQPSLLKPGASPDADTQHPRVIGASRAANTPSKPIHTPKRLAWFFNGSVAPIEDAELVVP